MFRKQTWGIFLYENNNTIHNITLMKDYINDQNITLPSIPSKIYNHSFI